MPFKKGQTFSPSHLFQVRILQVVLAIVYLVLLCYCGVHRGWWLNLKKPLGFGISASLLTILITLPDFFLARDFTPPTRLATYLTRIFFRVLFESVLMALWVAAFVTMFLPKGKDFRLLFHRPPYVQWDCAVALAAGEVFLSVWNLVLLVQKKKKYMARDSNGV